MNKQQGTDVMMINLSGDLLRTKEIDVETMSKINIYTSAAKSSL